MKIVYILFGFGIVGGVRYIYEVANGLAERGHDVSIIAPLGDPNCFLTKAKTIVCGGIITKPYLDFISGTLSLAKHIPKSDIVVSTVCFSTYPSFLARKGLPFYLVQHYEPLFFNDRFYRFLAKFSYKFPYNTITNSKWVAEILYEKFSKKSTIITPGVDLAVFNPKNVEKNQEKTVFWIGRKERWKGYHDFIEAMGIVYSKNPDLRVVVSSQDDIKESSIPIKVMKPRNDEHLAELYSSSDVFVSSSWYEGFGLPPLEAMACGAPVVTTDSGGINDFAEHGRNALIVPPRDPNKLAEAILKVLNDEQLAKKLVREGIRTVKKFTWRKTVDKTEKAFSEAMAKH